MFLRAIAKILDVKENQLEPKLVAPATMEAGWYDAIVVSSPFTKPTQADIEYWVNQFDRFDLAMIEINKEPVVAMLFDQQKAWANYILFLQSLSVDDVPRVEFIAAKTKVELDDRAAKEIIKAGKGKYLKRLAFANEIIAYMAYLNESKMLNAQQTLDQVTLLQPIKDALGAAMTTYARVLVDGLVPDEVLVTTQDKVVILGEIDKFLAEE